MMRAPSSRAAATAASSPAVSPLLLIAITTSPATICPALPCIASVACRKVAGVPVEASSDAA